jgi:hypothetical protein
MDRDGYFPRTSRRTCADLQSIFNVAQIGMRLSPIKGGRDNQENATKTARAQEIALALRCSSRMNRRSSGER